MLKDTEHAKQLTRWCCISTLGVLSALHDEITANEVTGSITF